MTFDPIGRYLNTRSSRLERLSFLRPMQVNELFDAGFSAYRTIGQTILKETAVGATFSTAGLTLFLTYLLPSFTKTSNAGNIRLEFLDSSIALLLTFLFTSPLLVFGTAMSASFICPLVADFIVGNVPDVKHAKAFSRSKGWTTAVSIIRQLLASSVGLVVALLLTGLSAVLNEQLPQNSDLPIVPMLVAMLAVLSWLIGGLIFISSFCMYSLAIPSALIEGLSLKESFRRSKHLMKPTPPHSSGYGALFSLIGLLLFIGLILFLGFNTAFELLKSFIPPQLLVTDIVRTLISGIPTFVAVWLLIPMWGISSTILYFERRVRLEGYDVEVLAQNVWRTNKGARFDI